MTCLRSAVRFMILILVAMSAGVSGCAKSVGALDADDERDPAMEHASRLERSNDFGGAVRAYQDALDQKPELVKAHLKLALLYDDYENNYLRAIYHYERYLELRPESEKHADIQELIRLARVNYAASIPEQASHAIRELNRVRQQANQMELDMGAAKRKIAALQVENGKLTSALGTARMRIDSGHGRAPAPGTPPAVAAVAATTKSISYTVQRGDSLSGIATKMYNDSRRWRAIYEANRAALDSPESLKVGQILKIPNSQSEGG